MRSVYPKYRGKYIKNVRLNKKDINLLSNWLEHSKNCVSSERVGEILDDAGDRIAGNMSNKIMSHTNANPTDEHIGEILSKVYYKVNVQKTTFKLTIGDNSKQFKYFEFGTGFMGYQKHLINTQIGYEKSEYDFAKSQYDWKYMSGKAIQTSLRISRSKKSEWKVYVHPTFAKMVIPNEFGWGGAYSYTWGGWLYKQSKKQHLFTRGQPGAFVLSAIKTEIADVYKGKIISNIMRNIKGE